MNCGDCLRGDLGGDHGRGYDAGDGVEKRDLAAGSSGGDKPVVMIEGRRCDPTQFRALLVRNSSIFLFSSLQ